MFFFSTWKKKVCVKRVFGFFLSFFTHKKWFSRTNFLEISRTVRHFHGHFSKNFHVWAIFGFTSWNRYFAVLCVKFFRKIWFSEKFHAQNSFFTGTFYDFFTDRFAFSRKENRFFSRTTATFSRRKKKTLLNISREIHRFFPGLFSQQPLFYTGSFCPMNFGSAKLWSINEH